MPGAHERSTAAWGLGQARRSMSGLSFLKCLIRARSSWSGLDPRPRQLIGAQIRKTTRRTWTRPWRSCSRTIHPDRSRSYDRLRKLNDDWHKEIIMDTANTKSQRVQKFPFFLLLLIINIVFLLALVIWVECLLRASAQELNRRTFASAEEASS